MGCETETYLGIDGILRRLFQEISGTGKTIAVEVIAGDVDFDLSRMDLSSVINKYVRETEKKATIIFEKLELIKSISPFR